MEAEIKSLEESVKDEVGGEFLELEEGYREDKRTEKINVLSCQVPPSFFKTKDEVVGADVIQGWIEVVCGSMFSGKTEELIRRIKRAEFVN